MLAQHRHLVLVQRTNSDPKQVLVIQEEANWTASNHAGRLWQLPKLDFDEVETVPH